MDSYLCIQESEQTRSRETLKIQDMGSFLGSPPIDEVCRLEHVAHYSAQMRKSSSLSVPEVARKIWNISKYTATAESCLMGHVIETLTQFPDVYFPKNY